MEEYKIIERSMNGGTQRLYRFENNFGASVVCHSFSYGNEQDLWELAVIEYAGASNDEFDLNYDTDITNDVLRHLSNTDLLDVLEKIKNL